MWHGCACRGSGASERELEALAIYMGHSLEMQRGSYDRWVPNSNSSSSHCLKAALNRAYSHPGAIPLESGVTFMGLFLEMLRGSCDR